MIYHIQYKEIIINKYIYIFINFTVRVYVYIYIFPCISYTRQVIGIAYTLPIILREKHSTCIKYQTHSESEICLLFLTKWMKASKHITCHTLNGCNIKRVFFSDVHHIYLYIYISCL